MDHSLPTEILIKIFKYLSANDIKSVCEVCIYWRNIVNNYGIWKSIWLHLLHTVNKTNLKNSLYIPLKKIEINDLDLQLSCLRLQNILYDKDNKLFKCLLGTSIKIHEVAVLRTHYSKVMLLFNDNFSPRNSYVKKNNDEDPALKSYMLFRQPPVLLDSVESLLKNQGHIIQLIWVYPMGVSAWLETVIAKLLGTAHVQQVLLIPRVIVLCENLNIKDALVIVSTARSTEVAMVVRGHLTSERWEERSVGGWRIAEFLHDAYTWQHPGEHNPRRFESPRIKAQCWMPPHHVSRCCQQKQHSVFIEENKCFVLKDELHLSAELMYSELNLIELVEKVSMGLSRTEMSRCLSHVLLAGGNCKLQHLATRVRLDLIAHWPKYADIISTSVHTTPTLLYTPPEITKNFAVINQYEYVCAK